MLSIEIEDQKKSAKKKPGQIDRAKGAYLKHLTTEVLHLQLASYDGFHIGHVASQYFTYGFNTMSSNGFVYFNQTFVIYRI